MSLNFTNLPPPATPSIIDLFPDSGRPTEGDTLNLTCLVSGTPAPNVTWQKDGVDIVPTNKIVVLEKQDNSKFDLQISDLEEGDSGVYHCSIFNPAGSDSREVRLEIAVPSKYMDCKTYFLQSYDGCIII